MASKTNWTIKTIPAMGTRYSYSTPSVNTVEFVIRDGITGKDKTSVDLELALTPEKRRRGLQNRDALGERNGMFFNCAGSFWMKDVEFPLDLLFVSDKFKILEIHHMPVDKKGARLYTPLHDESSYSIELNYGFCKKHKVLVGDTILPKRS